MANEEKFIYDSATKEYSSGIIDTFKLEKQGKYIEESDNIKNKKRMVYIKNIIKMVKQDMRKLIRMVNWKGFGNYIMKMVI